MTVKLNSNRSYMGALAGSTIKIQTNAETALKAQGLAQADVDANITQGNVTLNLQTGTAVAAIGAASVVITNSLVDANTKVIAYVSQAAADGTFLRVERVVPAAGSFTIYGTAAATAATQIDWYVVLPAGMAINNS